MSEPTYPEVLPNLIGGKSILAKNGQTFVKESPATDQRLFAVTRSDEADVVFAVAAAKASLEQWRWMPGVKRGVHLHDIVLELQRRRNTVAQMVAEETGKSIRDALGETDAAILQGLFFASEGQRLFGDTKTSGVENKHTWTVREPVGIAGLIIAANTPIANVAWKVFPALVCGNTVVLKSAEDTPGTAWLFGEIAVAAGLPDGVLNIVHGFGTEAGAPLAAHRDVGVISFTGSTKAGRSVQEAAQKTMAKVSLELGGKNPLLVCDDADIDRAVHWSILSAFSNAGQRCASGSRIIVFESVYDEFKARFCERTKKLQVGTGDDADLGPVINRRQLDNMLSAVAAAEGRGAKILVGGSRFGDRGCFMSPTILENVSTDDDISTQELFGPVTCLYRTSDFEHALGMANASSYGLTACIHTTNLNRAIEFSRRVEAGTVVINGGTFGSEPHYPFGGVKNSGNGTREPGREAIDIYTNLKTVSLFSDPSSV